MSFSQNDEERVIVDYFNGSVGTFMDIGANDGKDKSNTLRLAQMGASGLAIEPDPFAFCNLLANYKLYDITNAQCLNAFIGAEPGITKFYSASGDGISTANEAHRKKWEAQTTYREFFVPVITIRQVLDTFGSAWDFVSVDTEGTNLAVLETLPLDRMQTQLICVEHDGKQDEVIEYCERHGLGTLYLGNHENLILGR